MQEGVAGNHQDFSLITTRNCSLKEGERWRAFWLIALISAVIASALAAFGAWPVLPFAGMEIGALYVAVRCLARDAGDYEQLTIRGDRLVVESRLQGRRRRFDANRYWTQVVVSEGTGGRQLKLRSSGREIEFGTFLSERARLDAARELRNQLRVER
jgi:uncharacterized membrane protein